MSDTLPDDSELRDKIYELVKKASKNEPYISNTVDGWIMPLIIARVTAELEKLLKQKRTAYIEDGVEDTIAYVPALVIERQLNNLTQPQAGEGEL